MQMVFYVRHGVLSDMSTFWRRPAGTSHVTGGETSVYSCLYDGDTHHLKHRGCLTRRFGTAGGLLGGRGICKRKLRRIRGAEGHCRAVGLRRCRFFMRVVSLAGYYRCFLRR